MGLGLAGKLGGAWVHWCMGGGDMVMWWWWGGGGLSTAQLAHQPQPHFIPT